MVGAQCLQQAAGRLMYRQSLALLSPAMFPSLPAQELEAELEGAMEAEGAGAAGRLWAAAGWRCPAAAAVPQALLLVVASAAAAAIRAAVAFHAALSAPASQPALHVPPHSLPVPTRRRPGA